MITSINIFYIVGYLAIVVGLIGSVVPILPGPLLIWAGAFAWAWGNGFDRVGWPTLIVLGVLAVGACVLDFVLTTGISRRAGVSWRAIGGAFLGALLGAIFLSALPIIGTFVGAILGAAIGMWLIEYWIRDDAQRATAAVRAYLSGVTLSAAVQIVIALLMVLLFVWQAFF